MKMDAFLKEIKQQKGLVIGVIAAGLIFGFVVGRTIKGKEAGEVKIADKKELSTPEVLTINNKNSIAKVSTISLGSEQTSGKTVAVDKVSLTENSWIVVREDVNGEMGNILGAQWLPKGTESPTIVELLRGTVVGQKYYVVLWKDNGDRSFGKDTDTPMMNNGKLISASFVAK